MVWYFVSLTILPFVYMGVLEYLYRKRPNLYTYTTVGVSGGIRFLYWLVGFVKLYH